MNNLMTAQPGPQGAPQGAGPAAAPPSQPPPSPEELAAMHGSLGVIAKGLMDLASKPKGSLSKQDLYNSVADMIAGGAFSTPQEKQAIVAQLAQAPDNEAALRQLVGQKLLRVAQVHEAMRRHYPMQE